MVSTIQRYFPWSQHTFCYYNPRTIIGSEPSTGEGGVSSGACLGSVAYVRDSLHSWEHVARKCRLVCDSCSTTRGFFLAHCEVTVSSKAVVIVVLIFLIRVNELLEVNLIPQDRADTTETLDELVAFGRSV